MRGSAGLWRRLSVGPGRMVLLLLVSCFSVLTIFSTTFRYCQAGLHTREGICRSLYPSLVRRRLTVQSRFARAKRSGHNFPENKDCPLQYDRTSFEDIRDHNYRPYLLGGLQRPECRACHVDTLWSNFCQFKHSGPVCTQWDQLRLTDYLIQRAEVGAPGMEDLLTMTPCDLYTLLRGRTLWLEFHRATMCFFYEFWDVLETHPMEDLTTDAAALRKMSQFGGWCAFLTEGTRICHIRSNLGRHTVDVVLPTLPKLGAVKSDVVVINFAAWQNQGDHMLRNITEFAEYYREHREELPLTIWRDAASQHFDTPTGDFRCDECPPAEPPFECKPIRNVSLNARNELESDVASQRVVVEGGWRNAIINPILEPLGIPIIHTWNMSVPIWQYHHNFQEQDDCTHSCHPGPYQVWVFQMYEKIRDLRHLLPPVSAKNAKRENAEREKAERKAALQRRISEQARAALLRHSARQQT